MVAAVSTAAAATVLCAKAATQSLRSAGLPPVLCKLCVWFQKSFIYFTSFTLSASGKAEKPERRAVAVLMARFASPLLFPKISFYTVILSQQKRHYFEQQRVSLTRSKEKAENKVHLSRR